MRRPNTTMVHRAPIKTMLVKPTLAPSHHQLVLGGGIPADPAKQAEAAELAATVRRGAAYVQDRVTAEMEAETRSPEYYRLLEVAAALRQAILRADQVGNLGAFDELVAVRDQHLLGPSSVYAAEDEEKRRKKAQREKERRKRKVLRDREAAAAAKAAAVDAPSVAEAATEGDEPVDEEDDASPPTPVQAVDSLAASTISLDVPGSGQSTASVLSDKEGDDDEALSSSTPASSSHGDAPTATRPPSLDATTPVKPPHAPLPDPDEAPIASTSRPPSPVATLNWADDVAAAELEGIDAPTAAAIAAARAESPIPPSEPVPADDDWHEVVKAARPKRGERHDAGPSFANAPPPHAYESQAFVLRGRGVAGSTPASRFGPPSSSATSLPMRPTTLGDPPQNKSSWGRGNYVSGIKSAGFEDHDSHVRTRCNETALTWTART